jgi:hypothetical protein
MFNKHVRLGFCEMIPLLDVGWHGFSAVSERDADVLSLLDEENLTVFTFDGLKRRLGLHPETLSRILIRLEQEGVVKKEAHGYTVTPKTAKLRLQEKHRDEPHVPLLQTYLPSNMQVQHLIANLRGKWFGSLRWFGISEDNRGVTMKWVTEDGGIQINATIEDSTLMIDAKFLRDNNLNRALSASYQLMAYIGKLMSGGHLASHVGYFGDGNVFLMPA